MVKCEADGDTGKSLLSSSSVPSTLPGDFVALFLLTCLEFVLCA